MSPLFPVRFAEESPVDPTDHSRTVSP